MNRYTALAEVLRERNGMPFEWGKNDCCSFAADAVRAQTGRDAMAGLRGLYWDEGSAAHILAAPGGLVRLVNTWLPGQPLPSVATARRGDLIMFDSGNGPALGICVGDKFAAVKPGGLGYFAMRHAITAWRVE